MRMSHLAVLTVAVLLSGATAFAIAQPNQPTGDATKAGGSKKVVKELKKVNSNLLVINSNVEALNDNIGTSTTGTSVRGLLDDLNDRIGPSTVNDVQNLLEDLNDSIGRSTLGTTVRGLLDDIESNTSGP